MVSAVRVLVTAVCLVLAASLESHEWRWFRPSLTSQVQNLQPAEANRLLEAFCNTGIKFVQGIGLTCSVRASGFAFEDIVDNTFHPEDVIFGHFLAPDSDDAAVSGWSAETHPLHWGGTLLLTRQHAIWKPQWYKSALIVHSCEKMATPEKREILLCEDENGGMGHQVHYLYAVDLKRPADLRESLLALAESFSDGCTVQQQVMQPVHWTVGLQAFSVVIRTTEWRRVSTGACNGSVAKRPPLTSRLHFVAAKNGVRRTEIR
jgi:hypothetical protein